MPKLITGRNEAVILKNARRCKERGIILPTIRQQMFPQTIPDAIKQRIQPIGLWDIDPLNLFRQTGLFRDPVIPDRSESPHHWHGRKVFPHRRAQSGCRLWLPGTASCIR